MVLLCLFLFAFVTLQQHVIYGFESVRLSHGTNAYSGRVEIDHNGHWRWVCSDTFDHADAIVVCRMLAFPHPEKATAYVRAEFGGDCRHATRYAECTSAASNLQCNGSESHLGLCQPHYSYSRCYEWAVGVDCCPWCPGAPHFPSIG